MKQLTQTAIIIFILFSMVACNTNNGSSYGNNNTGGDETYTVIYYGNNNTGGAVPTDNNSYKRGAFFTIKDPGDLVRSGFTFTGWNTSLDGSGTSYLAGSSFFMGTENVILYATWSENPTYTVTYYGNSNTNGIAPTDNNNYEQGATITAKAPGSLVKTGFTFTGWNTLANGSGTTYLAGDMFSMGLENVVLYATWSANPTYTVTYYGNSNTNGTAPTDNNNYEQGATVTAKAPGSLVKTGSTFTGWNTSLDGSGTSYLAGSSFFMGTENVILYATWSENPTYTVTYYGNNNTGGTAPTDSNNYEQGATVTAKAPGSLVKTGFTFVEWNTAANGSGTSYAVTYYGNNNTGGTAPTDSNSYEQGATVTAKAPGSLTKTGSTFTGWNTLANGSGTTYLAGDMFSMGLENVVLYATWSANPTYTVTYYGNSNTSGTVPTDSNSYEQGATITAKAPGSLVKTGFTFTGWNTLANGSGTMYLAGDTFSMGATNVVLYATWSANPTYTVTYIGNGNTGGSAPTDSNNYEQGATVTAKAPGSLVKTGFTFVEWNTAANGTGTSYTAGSSFFMGTESIILYAIWSANPTYTVTYYGNTNTGGTAPTDSNNYEQGATVTAKAPGSLTKTGSTFTGWNTLANGSGTTYLAGDTFSMGLENVVLYATWSVNPTYTVTYHGNNNTGGTAPVDNNNYEQGATITAKAPGSLLKIGSTFTGWNTLANGSGTTYLAGDMLSMGAANVNLYAQWGDVPPVVGVVYVWQGATGVANGSSWKDAYTNLSSGINAASSGKQVWVASGTYFPTQEVGGTGDQYKAFQMKNGVEIYGGFNATETALIQRNITSNQTILSGNNVSYHVFNHGNNLALLPTAILDGFTISGGNANGTGDHNSGGAMLNTSTNDTPGRSTGSYVTVRNSKFINNTSTNGGGAIYNQGRNPSNEKYNGVNLINCTFENNSTVAKGGAIWSYRSYLSVDNCTFTDNTVVGASYGGSAIFVEGGYNIPQDKAVVSNSSFNSNDVTTMASGSDNGGTVYFRLDPGHAEITNCTFTNNTGRYGSGIFAKTTDVSKANSGLTITNCSFIGNQSTFAGGIFIDVLDAIVKDCTFKNNSALSQGGAIYSRGSTNTPKYTNCLLSGNRAESNGGGIYVNGGNPTFTNLTVAGNLAAANYGGGFRILAGAVTFNNSIINNNVGSTGSNCGSILTGASAVFNYSLIDESQIRLEGTGSFTNNNGLAGNPNFIDPLPPTTLNTPNQNGNYQLLNTSMCLDAGNNALNSEIFDITELTGRKLDKTTGAAGIIDLGAYEHLETVQ